MRVRLGSSCLLALFAIAGPTLQEAAAQEAFVVLGRIRDGQTDQGIQNAIVTLEGHRSILTGAVGEFTLPGVEAGEYTLRVEAFGYRTSSRTLSVDRGISLDIELDVAPFLLDSLVVAPRVVEVRGEVRDPANDLSLKDAEVRTSLGEVVQTGGSGRFDVRGWEGLGLLLQVRAFGYFPLDTVVAPTMDNDYLFNLKPDPFVQGMIDAEIERIEVRAGGRRAITMPALDRDDLLRLSGLSLEDLLRQKYGERISRISCVVLDERPIPSAMIGGVVRSTLAQDVERLEFLYSGRMLRIYTRTFMQKMVGGGVELSRATYVDVASPPFCT